MDELREIGKMVLIDQDPQAVLTWHNKKVLEARFKGMLRAEMLLKANPVRIDNTQFDSEVDKLQQQLKEG